MEICGLAQLAHELCAKRVNTDHELLEECHVGQCVTAGVAGHPVIGGDRNDGRFLEPARLWIPRRAQGRIDRMAIRARFD